METMSAQVARRDPEVRKALKKAQIARLAARGKPGYAKMFANQPSQIAKAKVQLEERQAAKAIRKAMQAAMVADAGVDIAAFAGGNDLETKPSKELKK